MSNLSIERADLNAVASRIERYFSEQRITVDSFWEFHVRKSNLYEIYDADRAVGYFGIFGTERMTLFHLDALYSSQAQKVFTEALTYEHVREAFVPTGDEELLCHTLDRASKIEKQAYFFAYSHTAMPIIYSNDLVSLTLLDPASDLVELEIEFLRDEIENIRNGIPTELYAAWFDGEVVGFGVIETGTILKDQVSIGMIVREKFRRRGFGTQILQRLHEVGLASKKRVVSGCWYWNHNSKKTIEKAGAHCTSRLLRIAF